MSDIIIIIITVGVIINIIIIVVASVYRSGHANKIHLLYVTRVWKCSACWIVCFVCFFLFGFYI